MSVLMLMPIDQTVEIFHSEVRLHEIRYCNCVRIKDLRE